MTNGVTDELIDRGMTVLVTAARAGKELTYTEFADQVPGVARRGPKTVSLLAAIAERSFRERDVLITVLVVSASTGLPSTGFFEIQRRLRPDDLVSDDTTMARRERYKVFAAYRAG